MKSTKQFQGVFFSSASFIRRKVHLSGQEGGLPSIGNTEHQIYDTEHGTYWYYSIDRDDSPLGKRKAKAKRSESEFKKPSLDRKMYDNFNGH